MERKITHYDIISYDAYDGLNKLIEHVNDAISEGAQPLGGVNVAMDGEDLFFYQAIVWFSEEDTNG